MTGTYCIGGSGEQEATHVLLNGVDVSREGSLQSHVLCHHE